MGKFDDIAKELAVDIVPRQGELEKEHIAISRSFISDTNTAPTQHMFQYAIQASVGDAVFGDYSTEQLEIHVANIAGKEAALFFPSGTMSNQVSLRTHLIQPPFSVLCDYRAHVYKFEGGGISFHSQASVVPVIPTNGRHLTLEDVKSNIVLGNNIHISPTRAISLENTLNGSIFPQDEIIRISKWAKEQNPPVKMHCDGARIWHVAAEKEMHLKELCDPFDSVSMCLSKGLGAPIGTVLVGNREFIERARWFRKVFGGGMRQTGSLAACGAYALTHNFKHLPGVHQLAQKLARELTKLGVGIISAETCMVLYNPSTIGLTVEEITEAAKNFTPPILLEPGYTPRFVLYYQTDPKAVDDLIDVIRQLRDKKAVSEGAGAHRQLTDAEAYHFVYQNRPAVAFD